MRSGQEICRQVQNQRRDKLALLIRPFKLLEVTTTTLPRARVMGRLLTDSPMMNLVPCHFAGTVYGAVCVWTVNFLTSVLHFLRPLKTGGVNRPRHHGLVQWGLLVLLTQRHGVTAVNNVEWEVYFSSVQ
jgi:hypothetical protein